VAIENQFNIATWASYLKAALPHFDKVYSGNEYVKMLLADSAIDVVPPKFLDRTKYNATNIRSMIISGDDWQKLVPNTVVKFLEKINAKNRLDIISKSDTKPTEH
jgi:nicotinamide-nucleotide adenylyltransferase